MTGDGAPASPQSGVRPRVAAPRRRRRRGGWLALLIAALWILGYGLGWFGRGAEPRRGGDASPVAPSARSPGAADAGGGDGGRRPHEVAGAPQGLGQVDGAQRAAAPMEGDRFESLLSLVRLQVASGDLRAAARVLERLGSQVQEASPQRDRVRRWSDKLHAAAAAVEQRAFDRVQVGEVLAADRAIESLAGGAGWRPTGALSAIGDLGGDWAVAPPLGALGPPRPLARGRKLRTMLEGVVQEAAVVACRGDELTIEVVAGEGRRFPSLPLCAVEPAASSVTESVELAIAAFRADRPRLGRLWMARALLAGGEVGPRGRALLAALRSR